MFHVTSRTNRGSIQSHGLDWTRMGDARGIAGSDEAEESGCFLCRDEAEAEWFARFTAPGTPLDIWAVDGVDESELIETDDGFVYLPRPIPPRQLTLVRGDVEPRS